MLPAGLKKEIIERKVKSNYMNHKWDKNNCCTQCLIRREMQLTRIFSHSHTYLSRAGIWEDRNVFTERPRYHYFDMDNQSMGVVRPDCIPPKRFDD